MSQMIEQARLTEIQKNLKTLPKKNRFTVDEVLNILSGEIKKLAGKGYTVKEIRQLLNQEGLSASLAKIKIILNVKNVEPAVSPALPAPPAQPHQPPATPAASIEVPDEAPPVDGPALQKFLAAPKNIRRAIKPNDNHQKPQNPKGAMK